MSSCSSLNFSKGNHSFIVGAGPIATHKVYTPMARFRPSNFSFLCAGALFLSLCRLLGGVPFAFTLAAAVPPQPSGRGGAWPHSRAAGVVAWSACQRCPATRPCTGSGYRKRPSVPSSWLARRERPGSRAGALVRRNPSPADQWQGARGDRRGHRRCV